MFNILSKFSGSVRILARCPAWDMIIWWSPPQLINSWESRSQGRESSYHQSPHSVSLTFTQSSHINMKLSLLVFIRSLNLLQKSYEWRRLRWEWKRCVWQFTAFHWSCLVNAFQWLIEGEEVDEDRWLMFYLLRLAIEVNGLHRACVRRCPLTHRWKVIGAVHNSVNASFHRTGLVAKCNILVAEFGHSFRPRPLAS